MKAIQFHGKEDIRLNEVSVPAVQPGNVKIRPAFVGICGTDVHEYTRGATLIPEEQHTLTGRCAPLTIGHEISGVVDEIGPDVTDVHIGDRVAIQPILSDGSCYACQLKRPNCCVRQGFYGLSTDGGLAEYLVVEAKNARKVPANVSLEVAALVEPLSVAWHAVNNSVTDLTTSALVVGAGPIGLCVMQSLKAKGISRIIAVETNDARQTLTTQAGATHFINPLTENVASVCASLCADTGGVHVAYDTAGKQVTLDQCISVLCVGGTVVNIAVWGGEAKILPNSFLFGEKRYMGTAVYTPEDFDEVIEAIGSGRMDPEFLITARIGLSQLVPHGILKLRDNPGSDIKILERLENIAERAEEVQV
ncbi:unnamed protein product [Zymoseptoria tritici ST99CH_1E4]|uniref:Enoyl reductase (ER) domain-containing protein n=1 Tax=Zymoseptoria tritici ST99CH_1E4 TaxID=1276532 RepID=A0A2H1GEU7_ZYMTR|nr:unnamed protein product [Zymoseptoria tritici ST99CH_1E4]